MVSKMKLAIVALLVLGSASAALARPMHVQPSRSWGCPTGNTACGSSGGA